ncbi:hypothetical protein [Thalassospira marina]|uniref:hypothetical protein n=1 Tax=Thalassospira marina TaxID=2048283 RepID=UPI001054BC9B|nr:hypothetical protein [Thalassospira marina]
MKQLKFHDQALDQRADGKIAELGGICPLSMGRLQLAFNIGNREVDIKLKYSGISQVVLVNHIERFCKLFAESIFLRVSRQGTINFFVTIRIGKGSYFIFDFFIFLKWKFLCEVIDIRAVYQGNDSSEVVCYLSHGILNQIKIIDQDFDYSQRLLSGPFKFIDIFDFGFFIYANTFEQLNAMFQIVKKCVTCILYTVYQYFELVQVFLTGFQQAMLLFFVLPADGGQRKISTCKTQASGKYRFPLKGTQFIPWATRHASKNRFTENEENQQHEDECKDGCGLPPVFYYFCHAYHNSSYMRSSEDSGYLLSVHSMILGYGAFGYLLARLFDTARPPETVPDQAETKRTDKFGEGVTRFLDQHHVAQSFIDTGNRLLLGQVRDDDDAMGVCQLESNTRKDADYCEKGNCLDQERYSGVILKAEKPQIRDNDINKINTKTAGKCHLCDFLTQQGDIACFGESIDDAEGKKESNHDNAARFYRIENFINGCWCEVHLSPVFLAGIGRALGNFSFIGQGFGHHRFATVNDGQVFGAVGERVEVLDQVVTIPVRGGGSRIGDAQSKRVLGNAYGWQLVDCFDGDKGGNKDRRQQKHRKRYFEKFCQQFEGCIFVFGGFVQVAQRYVCNYLDKSCGNDVNEGINRQHKGDHACCGVVGNCDRHCRQQNSGGRNVGAFGQRFFPDWFCFAFVRHFENPLHPLIAKGSEK